MMGPMHRWRAGVRPGLVVGAVAALLAFLVLPMFPSDGTADAVGAVVGTFVLAFTLIVLLYASGMVRPTDRTRRVPVNPWLLSLVLVTLVAALLTQCPR
jgi:uncharacterized membrane protein HdeD (DUF308 family)